jgi:hypothetical protein
MTHEILNLAANETINDVTDLDQLFIVSPRQIANGHGAWAGTFTELVNMRLEFGVNVWDEITSLVQQDYIQTLDEDEVDELYDTGWEMTDDEVTQRVTLAHFQTAFDDPNLYLAKDLTKTQMEALRENPTKGREILAN